MHLEMSHRAVKHLSTLADLGFSRGGGTLEVGVLTYYFPNFLPKTAWKWKNLDTGGTRPWRTPWICQWSIKITAKGDPMATKIKRTHLVVVQDVCGSLQLLDCTPVERCHTGSAPQVKFFQLHLRLWKPVETVMLSSSLSVFVCFCVGNKSQIAGSAS